MRLEGLAFFLADGRARYTPVSFTDELAGVEYGYPVALVRGWRLEGGQGDLARAVRPRAEDTVRVYVSPHATDLEITFLWLAGFRVRKVRMQEALDAGGRWGVAAWRHYREVVGRGAPPVLRARFFPPSTPRGRTPSRLRTG
jgi:hypothetical protein